MSNRERASELRLVKPSSNDAEQIPPHDEPRELALLAAIFGDNRAIDLVVDIVTMEDFYDRPRGLIFDAMVQIRRVGEIVSRVSVMSWLKDRGTLSHVGGPIAIGRIATETPVFGQVVEHARKIAMKARRRALIADLDAIRAEAFGDVGDDAEWLSKKARQVQKYAEKLQPNNTVSLGVALESFFVQLQNVVNRRGGISGYTTGISELDTLTAGWQGGEITLIGGETGLGKSAFAGNLAVNVASVPQKEVVEYAGEQVEVNVPIAALVLSLEMPKEQFAQRMVCGMARVNYKLLQIGEGHPLDLQRMVGASETLSQLHVYLDDEPGLTMERLEAKVARLEQTLAAIGVRLGLVLLDYFQLCLFVPDDKSEQNREQLLAKAARRLQQFASRFKARPRAIVRFQDGSTADAGLLSPSLIAFGVLTQLNNDGQVRESKAILQHSQNFWLLEGTTDTPEGPGKTTRGTIRIKKQRGGEREVVAKTWRHAAYTLYSDEER